MAFTPDDRIPAEDDVERSKLKRLQERMRARMADLRISNPQLSRAIGRHDGYVWELLKGRNLNPSAADIQSIAKVLRCPVEYLYGDVETAYGVMAAPTTIRIPLTGIAETSTFRQMTTEIRRTLDHAPSRRYPNARHFALEVRGDGMNACHDGERPTPIYEGMYALCVDIASANIPIESGRLYAVQRTLDGGATFETSVRRALVYRDRIELIPESTNPIHQTLTISADNKNPSVTVIGLVYSWVYNFPL
jgi:transcriptional regulator with XRE-family HTH domain